MDNTPNSGFDGQYAQQADLTVSCFDNTRPFSEFCENQSFLSALRPDLNSGTTFALDTLDGGSNPQGSGDAGIEAVRSTPPFPYLWILNYHGIQNLDIQYTVGVAQGVPVTFVSAGSDNSDGWDGFLDMVNYLLALDTIPNVLTTSYAFNEPGLDAGSANNLCNAYMQLGARGTSIV